MKLSSLLCCVSNPNTVADSIDPEATLNGAPSASVKSIPTPKPTNPPPPKQPQTQTQNGHTQTQTQTQPQPQTQTETKPKPKAQNAASQPYTAGRATSLFSEYADPDDPDVIGAEGLSSLCEAAQIPLEGAMPLILAWQLGTSTLARITKEEWEKGTSALRISSLPLLCTAMSDLENLLILGKPPVKSSHPEPYNRTRYHQYAANKEKAFNELYSFCFALAKPEQGRNIESEVAIAFWTVLVTPKYPLMEDILTFINEKAALKGVNKDLWSMVLEFCQTVSPTLDNYEADGAWPTLLDEFVAWKRSAGNGEATSQKTAAD